MIFYFLKNKKIILGALIAVVLMASLAPQAVVAQESKVADTVDLIGGVSLIGITTPIAGSLYIVNFILAGVMTFVSHMTTLAIDFGNNMLKVPAVLAGWSVMLNFTNLGFVLGIIIIAFATIFRLENYAIKQTLWKLIVAALLVNFSLVIAGGFISVSKLSTDVFYNHITHNKEKSMGDVLGTLAQPQETQEPAETSWYKKFYEKVKNGASMLSFSGALKIILGLTFQVLMSFIIILTFITLIVMLLVRAVALIFLLILSPIVWLLWIFPSTNKYWKQWWQEFIRWNFFAPAVMFFIYLAVLTRNGIKDVFTQGIISSAENALKDTVPLAEGMWSGIMNNIVIMSILIGGIYVANKFGIAGGNIGINLAQKAGKGAGAWAGRKGLSGVRRAGSGIFGNEFMRDKIGGKLQKLGSGLDPNTKLGKFGRFALSPFNKAGNAVGALGVRQGEAAVKDAEKKYGHLSDKELGTRMHQFNFAERQYALQRMAKNDTLGMVSGGVSQYITDKEKNTWARYGQGKQWGDLTKTLGYDENVVAAAKNIDESAVKNAHTNLRTAEDKFASATSGFAKMDAQAELMKAQRIFEESGGKALQEAMSKFESGLSARDRDKMSANIISQYNSKTNNLGWSEGKHNVISLLKQNEMMVQAPETISKMRTKLKGDSLIDFNANVERLIGNIEEQLSNVVGKIDIKGKPTSWNDASSRDKINYLSKSKDDKIISKLSQLLKIEKGEKGAMERSIHTLDRLYSSQKHFGGHFEFGYQEKT